MNKLNLVDFLACEKHNFQHLLPVWDAIPRVNRGIFYILSEIDDKSHFPNLGNTLQFYDSKHDLIQELFKKNNLLVTSSFYDYFLANISRPMSFLAHGGGQTFRDQPLHHFTRKNYVFDILPNQHMASTFSLRYPFASSRVVGCPKLDKWHSNFTKPLNPKPVIALSFHFDRQTNPETRSAWPHFRSILPRLATQKNWTLLGHGHPRILDELCIEYDKLGIEVVRDFNEILARADLYICDHMSTLYEFASTDRPVVVLNAPWYRRDIEHGLRFWEHADVGINCDHPNELFDAIELALTDPPDQQNKRTKAVKGVYMHTDGKASQRAANAIVEFVSSWESNPGFLYPGTTEEGIRTFLSDSTIWSETLASKCEFHKKEILKAISSINESNPLHIADLEFHFWALALFLCKLGKNTEAKKICTDFYLSFGGSEILGTVFRQLLLTPVQSKPRNTSAPLVSVVIPLYNQGVFLEDSVMSVVNQSYPKWELIIVNDGSTDDSLETAQNLVQRYSDQPIIILNQDNKGKGFTRNRGVSESSGRYVCILDADDMLGSTYLDEAVSCLEQNQEAGWITPITLQFGRVHQIFYHFDFDLKVMLTVCPSPITSIFRRELWDEVEGFDETMTDREDWEFWIKAAEAGWSSLHTDTPQFMYRIQEKRFGERSDVNINSKLEIIQRHPWWFKSMSREQLVSLCGQFSTCNFTPEILNTTNVQKMTDLPKNRPIRKRLFTQIKDDWMDQNSHAPQPAVNSKAASLLRLAAHYAEKGDHNKAERYRDQARKSK